MITEVLIYSVHVLLLAFAIFGAHLITRDGMLLGVVERAWERAGNPWYSKPLTECPVCMSSVWGITFFIMVELQAAGIVMSYAALAIFALLATAGAVQVLMDIRVDVVEVRIEDKHARNESLDENQTVTGQEPTG